MVQEAAGLGPVVGGARRSWQEELRQLVRQEGAALWVPEVVPEVEKTWERTVMGGGDRRCY